MPLVIQDNLVGSWALAPLPSVLNVDNGVTVKDSPDHAREKEHALYVVPGHGICRKLQDDSEPTCCGGRGNMPEGYNVGVTWCCKGGVLVILKGA